MPKKYKKKEELPSFLRNLTSKPEEIDFTPYETVFDQYLGPIFCGGCRQYHPVPHSLNLRDFHQTRFKAPLWENPIENIFLPPKQLAEKPPEIGRFRPRIKRRKLFRDPCLHRCPGQRRGAAHGLSPRVVDFGETSSKIQGETSREIPTCRLKTVCSRSSQEEYELVTMSDIRERSRMFMSPDERAAHAHFLKEFVTVRVVGPTIPAAFTITQIPSRRKRLSDFAFHSPPKIRKTSESERKQEKTEPEEEFVEREGGEETAVAESDAEEEMAAAESETGTEEEIDSDKESPQMEETEEEDDFREDSQFLEEEEQTAEDVFFAEEEEEEDDDDEEGGKEETEGEEMDAEEETD